MEKRQAAFIALIIGFNLIYPTKVVSAKQSDALLFAGKSCGSCEKIKKSLKKSAIKYKYYDVDITDNYLILVKLEKKMGKESDKLPVLIHNDNFIEEKSNILKYLNSLQDNHTSKTTSALQSQAIEDGNVHKDIEKRFLKINTAAIAAAGFVDGINPCAFATIAFLAGCLTAAGKSRKKALAVGLSFSAGIFVTYFAIGLGLFHSLFALNSFSSIREYFHISVIIIFIIAGMLCLIDAVYTSKNNGIPLFKLPEFLRKRSNHTIARGLHTERWVLGGFGIGVIVSVLEFACTGQIYIPTILYMINTGAMISKAYYLFAIYNFMFIVPLLIVLALCIKGFEAKRLWEILKKRAALSKVFTGALFFIMAILMWVK